MITITIENGIRIQGLDNVKVREKIKKAMTLDNPNYFKLKNMGVRVWPGMATFKYYKEDKKTGDLIVPRGVRTRLLEFLVGKMGMNVEVVDKTVNIDMKDSLVSKVVLRDYQEPIMQSCLINSEGIVCVGTGGGKTIIACEAIARLKKTSLVVVPNTVLMQQFVEEFQKNYNYTPGIIGDGKKEWQNDTVVSTVQSLQTDKELLYKLANKTSLVFFDECQSAVSEKRTEVLDALKPAYFFGLTATPTRGKEDGRTDAIEFYFGKKIADYQVTQLNPSVHVIPTDINIRVDEYGDMISDMVNNEERNTLIRGIVMGEVMSGRKVLVLTKRIEHYKKLEEGFSPEAKSTGMFFIDSEDKDRNNKLTLFKFGKKDYSAIFGTTSLLAVGLDIPSFDTLVLACDLKSEVLTVQAAGRILRLFEGKTSPIIYDLWDNKNPILTRQFKERQKVYEGKGWEMYGRFWK